MGDRHSRELEEERALRRRLEREREARRALERRGRRYDEWRGLEAHGHRRQAYRVDEGWRGTNDAYGGGGGGGGRDEDLRLPPDRRVRSDEALDYAYRTYGLAHEAQPPPGRRLHDRDSWTSDEHVRAEVVARLEHFLGRGAELLEVSVQGGDVFVGGLVPDLDVKRRVAEIAEDVPGVLEVLTELRVARR